MSTKTKLLAELIRLGFPEATAKKILSGELPMDQVSRMARAKEQGYVDDVYHASMQDIQGGFKAGYDDGLIYTTPQTGFANDWVGKGKMQRREGADDVYEALKARKRNIQRPDSEDFDSPEWKAAIKERNEITREENNFGKAIYPLKAKSGRTFNPETDYKDALPHIEEYWGPVSESPVSMMNVKSGNYIYYENPTVAKGLQDKGYDSIMLRESSDGDLDTLALPPENLRSRFAAFDPDNAGKNTMMGSARPDMLSATAGATGLMAKLIRDSQDDSTVRAPKNPKTAMLATMLRDGERAVKGSPAEFVYPSGLAPWLERLAYNEDPSKLETAMAIADFLP